MFFHQVDQEVALGLLQHQHSQQLFTLVDQNRSGLREWLNWVDGTQTVADTEVFIERSLQRFAHNNGVTCGIWYGGELCGCIDLHEVIWSDRKSSIGYWLAAPLQGKGIMTRACQGLLQYGFEELNLNRVVVYVATGNAKSRAIPERLGFEQEGVLRQAIWMHDRFLDLVVYSLLANEWKA
jgi:ribosomal-protein-serine acetyltransferase